MKDTSTATIFVGLDVHKKTIAVATVEARASADVRFYGTLRTRQWRLGRY